MKTDKKLRLKDIILYFQLNKTAGKFLPQMKELIKLILTIPGSSCTNERLFSALRRLKSYLRSKIKQDRLNDISILHIYKELCSEINIGHILNKFIQKLNIRRQTFATLNE